MSVRIAPRGTHGVKMAPIRRGIHPDQVWIRIGNNHFRVTPKAYPGEARAAAWQRIKTQSPVFAGYETKTDRELPIVRLTQTA